MAPYSFTIARALMTKAQVICALSKENNSVFRLTSTWAQKASWETQGQLVGAGKSRNGREKNSGEEKSTTRRAPGDKVLTDQFQTVGVILASDWCQKTFAFSAQSQSSKTRSRFASSYTIDTSRPVARHVFMLVEESSNHSTKCRGDCSTYPQETRGKYAGPFAGIVTLAHLIDWEFLYTPRCR